MAEPTKGPWHCNPEADLHRIGVYSGDGDDIIICDVTDEDLEHDGEAEANARLIAASPRLLKACQEVRRWMEEDTLVNLDEMSDDAKAVLETVRAAINEATGEEA